MSAELKCVVIVCTMGSAMHSHMRPLTWNKAAGG